MKKQTRKEKKEEEKRIIAQFEEGLKEERGGVEKESSVSSSIEPDKLHCRRCKTLMEEGVCPVCGYKIYQPMSEEKRRKIKRVITVVALAVFVVFLVIKLI